MNIEEMTEVYKLAKEFRQSDQVVMDMYNHQYKKMIYRNLEQDKQTVLDVVHKDTLGIMRRYFLRKDRRKN